MSADERPPEPDTEQPTEPEPKEPRVVTSVRKWLNQQGFPLEMRVARAFHSAGATVQQSEFYTSPEGKQREIDICARFAKLWRVGDRNVEGIQISAGDDSTHYVVFDVFAVVECKSGPRSQKPWVVFTSTRNRLDAYTRFHRLGSLLGRETLSRWADDEEVKSLPLFNLSEPVGYALACAHQNDDHDQAYAALTSLAAAARARSEPRIARPEVMTACRLVFPMLVVDTPIVECWLDDDGQIQLRERDQMTIVWRNPMENDPYTVIEILHESAVPRYVEVLRSGFLALRERRDDVELALAVGVEPVF